MNGRGSGLSGEQIEFLLLLSRMHSLTRTASALGLSVATVSRMLGAVREIFDDELFVRSGNSMAPTRRMTALVPKLERARAVIEDLVSEEYFDPANIHRVFHLMMNDNAFVTLLLKALPAIRRRAPDIRIRVMPPDGSLIEHLRSGRLDLAFFYDPDGNPLPADIHGQQLFASRHVVVVRNDHPLASCPGPVSEEEVRAYPLVSLRLPDYRGESTVEVMHRTEITTNAGIYVETPYFVTLPFALLESDAYAVMTRELAERFAAWMPLKILDVKLDPDSPLRERWNPTVIRHSRSNDDHQLQWLRAAIVECFQERRRNGEES